MIRRDGDTLVVDGAVTLQTVPDLVGAAEEHFRSGVRKVSFGQVTEVDSSAIALALEWQRQAARSQVKLLLADLPQTMLNLASLYGVADLL